MITRFPSYFLVQKSGAKILSVILHYSSFINGAINQGELVLTFPNSGSEVPQISMRRILSTFNCKRIRGDRWESSNGRKWLCTLHCIRKRCEVTVVLLYRQACLLTLFFLEHRKKAAAVNAGLLKSALVLLDSGRAATKRCLYLPHWMYQMGISGDGIILMKGSWNLNSDAMEFRQVQYETRDRGTRDLQR